MKSKVNLWYVVRDRFLPHIIAQSWVDVELTQGCLLKVEAGTNFMSCATGLMPRVLYIQEKSQPFDCHLTFHDGTSQGFGFHFWGPYTEEVASGTLWIFRGSVGSGSQTPKLKGVGRHCERIMDNDTCNRVLVRDNWDAILQNALLMETDGEIQIAPTADFKEVLSEDGA